MCFHCVIEGQYDQIRLVKNIFYILESKLFIFGGYNDTGFFNSNISILETD